LQKSYTCVIFSSLNSNAHNIKLANGKLRSILIYHQMSYRRPTWPKSYFTERLSCRIRDYSSR